MTLTLVVNNGPHLHSEPGDNLITLEEMRAAVKHRLRRGTKQAPEPRIEEVRWNVDYI